MNYKFKTLILVLSFLFLSGCQKGELTLYTKILNYFDSDIEIKLYSTSKKKANKAFEEIENIYSKYDNITNRSDQNSEISYIYNNTSKDKSIKVSNEMKDLINFGIKWYKTSDGLISINTGDIIDLWNDKYKQNLIPTSNELININTDIDKITLKGNKLDNNHVNLSFNLFIKGYTNKKVEDYLKSINIDTYFINTGSEIMTGTGIDNEDYVIAISNPFDDSLLEMFNVQNKYIVTKSIYHNAYKYDSDIYSSIVNAKNKTMSNNMVSVTVVSDEVDTGEMVANMLFMLDYEDGLKIANKYNVKAIWCYLDKQGNEIIKKTDNM